MVKKYNDSEWDYADNSEDGDSGDSSHSGTGTSGVDFHLDFLTGENRDDLLAPEDLKRLLKIHHDLHYELVKKQKTERKTRLDAKEGKRPIIPNTYTGGTGFSTSNNALKTHPITHKAYFSGIDKKVTLNASENENIANEESKKELEHRYELQNRLQHTQTPKFNPKPRPI